MPTIRQLDYLIALADERHFRRAAERCGISQPTLSAQIAALEQELGVPLVERGRTALLMTPAGQDITNVARRIASDVRQITSLAESHRHGGSRLVRVGLPHSIGPYLLPAVLPLLRQQMPDLRLYVREDLPISLPDALDRGEHDVLIVPVPAGQGDCEQVLLFREPLHLVAPADHPLARQNAVRVSDLKGQALLSLGRGHQLRSQVEAFAEEHGAHIDSSFEGTSLDTLRHMVATGIGLSFVPDLYVRKTNLPDDAVRIVRLTGRALYRTIGMVWRCTDPRRSIFLTFASGLRQGLAQSFPGLHVLGENPGKREETKRASLR